MTLFAVEDLSSTTILLGVLSTVTTAMGTALGILWRRVDQNYRECRDDRNRLYDKLLDVVQKGCADMECTDRMPLPMAKVTLSNGGRRDLERERDR